MSNEAAAIRRWQRIEVAAHEIDEAWDAWMMDEEGEGQERVEQAIAKLRETLRDA